MTGLSVRNRLILWNTGVLAVSLLAFGIVIHQVVVARLTANLDTLNWRDAANARAERAGSDPQSEARANALIADALSRLQAIRRPHGAAPFTTPNGIERNLDLNGNLVDPENSANPRPGVLDQSSFDVARRGVDDFRDIKWRSRSWRLASVPGFQNGVVKSVIQVARPKDSLVATTASLDRVLLQLIPFALLFAVIAGAFLTRNALQPIAVMAKETEAIGAGTLSRRLESRGGDEIGRLSASFNAMLERLDRSFEAQRQFTADAAHELRTPLTAIKANTSLTLEGDSTEAECRNALQVVDRSASLMNGIVGDLLLLSQSDAGELLIFKEQVWTGTLLSKVWEAFAAEASRVGVDLTPEAEGNPVVLADPIRLERILGNLVANALAHTSAGGKVILSAADSGENVVIRVEDSGSGIDAVHQDRVFDRFYRVDNARAREKGGAGLGLSICRELTEAMGGTISLRSKLGEGTVVEVTLPASQRPE